MSNSRTKLPGLSGSLHFWKYAKQGAAMALCVLLLSACGPVSSLFDNEPARPRQQISHSDPLTPPGMDNRPVVPANLQVAQGVNAEMLFSERVSDSEGRFYRLENAVTDLRRDLNNFMPAITRLVSVESDIQSLIGQLEMLVQTEPLEQANSVQEDSRAGGPAVPLHGSMHATQANHTPMAIAGEHQSGGSTPPVMRPASSNTGTQKHSDSNISGLHVKRLRIGEHKDKTRLVIDTSGPVTYRHDLDNDERILIVEVNNAHWAGRSSWSGAKAPLVSSYSVQPTNNGGSRLVVILKHSASITKVQALPANGYQDHRVFLDLVSPAVHK